MAAHENPTPSKVALFKHPLHPMVVVFPTAFLIAVPVTDLVFWLRGGEFWALASFWLVVAGFGVGLIAALLGLADFLFVKEVRNRLAGWTHMLCAVMTMGLAGANVQLRLHDPVAAALPWGLILSVAMAGMVGVTGWLGGTLTFGHGIGTYLHHHDEPDESDSADGR